MLLTIQIFQIIEIVSVEIIKMIEIKNFGKVKLWFLLVDEWVVGLQNNLCDFERENLLI
jgi:hypothetical protein